MELWELIHWLEQRDPSTRVRNGFGAPSSYRGYYQDVAFQPVRETTIGEMLVFARSAVDKTFKGYKGGQYKMDEFTRCWIAPYGQTVDAPITVAALEMMIADDELARLRVELACALAARDEIAADARLGRAVRESIPDDDVVEALIDGDETPMYESGASDRVMRAIAAWFRARVTEVKS